MRSVGYLDGEVVHNNVGVSGVQIQKSSLGEIVPAEQMRRVKHLVWRDLVHLSTRSTEQQQQQQQLVGSWSETCTKRKLL